MLLSGSAGAATRAAMDSLMNEYNERLVKIVKDYQQAHYSDLYVYSVLLLAYRLT